jgi:hypothetical protein
VNDDTLMRINRPACVICPISALNDIAVTGHQSNPVIISAFLYGS